MELINQILQTIINSFDIAYCFVVNLLTYILISSITTVIHKQITRVWKRVILCISIVIVSIAYINFGSIDIRVLINSIILAPISWSWVFKPIAKRMNWDYKDFDNKLNNQVMDINKIYNALQSLPLSIEQKNLLIEAFTSGEQNVQQPEISQQEDSRIEDLKREVEELKETVKGFNDKLSEIVLPSKATKYNEGLVKAITNIKNLEVSTATIPTIVGAINTLLLNLRTAGIIEI